MEDDKKQIVNFEEELEKHNKTVDTLIKNIETDKFNVYFYCPAMNTPSGGVAVLFKMAKLISDSGVTVKLVYQPKLDQRVSYEVSQKEKKEVNIYEKLDPKWLDFDISDLEIIPLGDGKIRFQDDTISECKPLQVNPHDFLMIPEGFPDMMKKTIQVPCKRIVIAQSWFYILNAMGPGEKWQNFGIKDVISVSDAITEYIHSVMPGGLNIKQFSQSIDRNLFKLPAKFSEKYPMVGFMAGRGPENRLKTYNIIKTFQAFYPHLKWVRFMELNGLSKEEFSERLASCAFALYTDDIAGFGTFPLEAMACGTHVVGWNSFGGKEYITQDNGFWSNNCDIFQAAELLGIAIDKWLTGEMDVPEIQATYEATLSRYTVEKEQEQILKIFNEYKNERINELKTIKK